MMIELTNDEVEAVEGFINVRLAQLYSRRKSWGFETLANEEEANMLVKLLDKLCAGQHSAATPDAQ